MKFTELSTYTEAFRPAYMVDSLLRSRGRELVRGLLGGITILLGVVILLDRGALLLPQLLSVNELVNGVIYKIRGVFFISASLLVCSYLLEAFYFSHISHLAPRELRKKDGRASYPLTYDVARIVYQSNSTDMLSGFLNFELSKVLFERLEIPFDAVKQFLSMRGEKTSSTLYAINSRDMVVTFSDYARSMYDASNEFETFLASYGVTQKVWSGAADWISRERYKQAREKRFWSREMLARIPSLGKDWAFGKAYTLMKYANLVQEEPFYRNIDESLFVLYRKEFEEIETVLVRSSGANALVVSDDPQNGNELIAMLAMAIERGYAYPQIEGKRVFFLRSSVLLNGVSTKEEFEQLFTQIFKEAADVGNIVLAIENFSVIVDSAHAYGTDIVSLLGLFLSSPEIHVIALVDERRYHDSLEPNKALVANFERVVIPEKDKEAILRILEDEVLLVEYREKIFVTYLALRAIVENTERYFSESYLYDKARDILIEIGPFIRRHGKNVVRKEDVLELFEEKTGIPQGEVKEFEKEKLLNLETVLHKRVIGQDEAVTSIANAMRRARSGVGNPNRPIGSFLFLGPTGVGKTETTKALAESFFGSEEAIIRFDMSEYKTDDALTRLIGSFKEGKSGTLSTKLREKPYAVVLLDEFEKTNKEVLDLFLQILDEGFFSDMDGNRVNMRNAIIIATSNAGSDAIFEYVKAGTNLQEKKQDIISSIIDKGIFKPELINRFDGTILFHPLGGQDLKKIAGLMLLKLEARLKEKGIILKTTDELLSHIAEQGMDPAFGARPMNRYIQEKIEALVADKMLRGQINEGDTVQISPAELA